MKTKFSEKTPAMRDLEKKLWDAKIPFEDIKLFHASIIYATCLITAGLIFNSPGLIGLGCFDYLIGKGYLECQKRDIMY